MKKRVKLNKPPSHQSLHLSSKEKSLISSKESISGKEVTSVKTSELDESLDLTEIEKILDKESKESV